MTSSPLVKKLANFGPSSPEEKERVERLSSVRRRVGRKRDIVSEGDNPTVVQLMVRGWAARYRILPDGARQITAILLPGDFCDLHVTILKRMDHGIIALTECEVAQVRPEQIEQLTQIPAITRALWWATLLDEAILREWVVNAGRRDAYAAVSHLLCELHLRMYMIGDVTGDRLSLPLTQEELADAIGMTSVHVNRMLMRLKEDGLIEIERRILTMLDVEGLRRAAGFDPAYLHLNGGALPEMRSALRA